MGHLGLRAYSVQNQDLGALNPQSSALADATEYTLDQFNESIGRSNKQMSRHAFKSHLLLARQAPAHSIRQPPLEHSSLADKKHFYQRKVSAFISKPRVLMRPTDLQLQRLENLQNA